MVVNDVDLWVPRVSEGEKDEIPDYGHPDYFTVKVYHGGCIRDSKYVGGKVDFYDNVDKDRMSLVEVDNMVRQLNPAYSNQRIDYWYKVGDEDDELIKQETDRDVMIMCCVVPQWRLIILYLDHMELHSVFREEDDDIFMYEDFLFNEGRSSSVIIEELPDDELRRKPTCVIEEVTLLIMQRCVSPEKEGCLKGIKVGSKQVYSKEIKARTSCIYPAKFKACTSWICPNKYKVCTRFQSINQQGCNTIKVLSKG
ncbi:uncharacterized protein LOC133740625 [Rosa rugosa]|uniref:uncharacterized protein LOC133740625 n=1 Tax=Rosa rugosa TaxID=74645 RepID=UPI002B408792|nr:uncharacterized protein LOC133740625 [Rosa rugosa]